MHDNLRYLVIACAFTCAACAPRTSPTPPAPPPAAQRSAPPPLPVPNEPVRRTGLHPDLFRDAYDLQPTPTATPTEVAKTPTPGFANEDGFQAPPDRGESLEPLIARSQAPNVTAALRLVEQARLQIDRRRFEPALDLLERAVAVDPTSVHGYYYLAVLHFERASYAQALGFSNRAVVLATASEPRWAARSHALQGEIFEKVGRYPDARSSYARALEIDSSNVTARVGLHRLGGEREEPRAPW